MKKLIFSVFILSMSLPGWSQSTNLGIGGTGTTTTPSPSGASFGGSMSGADPTFNPGNVPATSLPSNNSYGAGNNSIQTDQMRIQEQQASPVSPSTPLIPSTTPSATPSPTQPASGNISPSPMSTSPASGATGSMTP